MQFNIKKENKSQLTFNSDGTITLPEAVEKDLRKQRTKILDIWDHEETDELLHNLDDNVVGFNLYSNEERLQSLRFSNNKTQDDVVEEVVNLIKNDNKKVVFIRGVCGTGKSAIALNIAKSLGKASIVVPGKALQKQYQEDYSRSKYVLKDNHKKLKIKVITGRDNHRCLYKQGSSAGDNDLPCKIEIKEKNYEKLKEYLKKNDKVKDDIELKDIRRMSIAPICPYWSPSVPSHIELNLDSNKKTYTGLNNIEYTIHNRKQGCTYYNQFNSYINNEVIVFNSAKYNLESAMNRKPFTDVEIIDECDEFLDSFSNIKTINLTRFSNSLINVFIENEDLDFIMKKIINLTSDISNDSEIKNLVDSEEIMKINNTKIFELLNYFLNNPKLLDEIDEDNYSHSVHETALMFGDFFDETYVRFRLEERGLMVDLVSVSLAKKFQELVNKNEAVVLMSGTIHSENVLRDVFGIKDFEIIDAEITNQGNIEIKETGLEFDCKYDNFKRNVFTRKQYLVALDKSVEESIKPTLVHVNSFDDLPSEEEKERFELFNLMTKNKLLTLQKNDFSNKIVDRFKSKQVDVLFTTKCNRGVDFPGDQCRSIVFTKFPNPNAGGIFWKILKKTNPQYYWAFYKDKAKREFLQKIYRGVRHKDDHVYILSPDKRVLNSVNMLSLS